MPKIRVLLTGGGGRVGKHLQGPFRARYSLRNYNLEPIPDDAQTVLGDLSDIEVLKSAMQGVDVVVHLAAQADEAPFLEKLLMPNCAGIHNVLQAARQSGVRRVVFASSVQTVDAYPQEKAVLISDPVCPNSIYGATKVFGEAMGRYFHEKFGLEFIALRLGAVEDYAKRDQILKYNNGAIWLSPRDVVQLFERAIETPNVGFCVAFGTSKPSRERLNLKEAREILKFEPQDSSEELLQGAYDAGHDPLAVT